MIPRRKFLKDFDFIFLFNIAVIFIIGLFVLYSASFQKSMLLGKNFAVSQMMWMVIAGALFFFILAIDYLHILNFAYLIYGLSIVLLLSVFFLGKTFLGAQRWIVVGGFTFQPSEFAKVATIMGLAYYMGARKLTHYRLRDVGVPFVMAAIPMVLILQQPDLGTAILFVPVILSMLFVWGVKYIHLIGMILLGIGSMPFFWFFLKEYQKKRLLVFLNPDMDPLGAGYTITQSKIAVGSGGLFGKGWLTGTQNQLNFLPERHTDFIFSVIGEEWGFLGACLLIILYFFMVKRGLAIASATHNLSGKLMVTGLVVMIAFQVIVNIGMAIGIMPVVGVPLPLISYGGSSLLITMIALGLILNTGSRRTIF